MSRPSNPEEVIIVGGGQAGLATAYYLRKAGIDSLIIDDQPGPGGAWRHVWPSMTLFSTSGFSNLPGMQMPDFEGFPPASHVVDYLTAYETRYDLRVLRPVTVRKVTHDGMFHVELSEPTNPGPTNPTNTRTLHARHIVAATGTWRSPFVPHYPGTTTAHQWHSANYPGPEPFRGSRVAVVGSANSGAQIAAELSLDDAVPHVTWYTRHAPRWMPDDVDGRVLFARNRARALAVTRGEADPGADSTLGDIVVLPNVKKARDSGSLTWTPMFSSLGEVDADHIIWCTGFRPAIGPFRGLDRNSFDFVGYGDWVGPGAATIVGVGPFAKRAAARIARDIAQAR
nr:FAD-dependent oxidoreductase [Corynebacterium lactis]